MPAHAWVYSEHRDIAMQAVQYLDEEYQADLNKLWQASRYGYENKLCESVADLNQGLQTECLDWAAFSAIAGDHACSSEEMLDAVLNGKWLLDIANVSAQLKSELVNIPVEKPGDEYRKIADGSNTILEQFQR